MDNPKKYNKYSKALFTYHNCSILTIFFCRLLSIFFANAERMWKLIFFWPPVIVILCAIISFNTLKFLWKIWIKYSWISDNCTIVLIRKLFTVFFRFETKKYWITELNNGPSKKTGKLLNNFYAKKKIPQKNEIKSWKFQNGTMITRYRQLHLLYKFLNKLRLKKNIHEKARIFARTT